jgi:alkanesulfonate monooxygenase SsuD/methylene tetrahydromethanopterin reductase-like flavin-dependent oxidoreductase (luciferase family)
MAAALACRTSRAALVVLGRSIALYDPPIRVAEEFAMLDVIAGGRLVAGFPVGTSMDTNYAYGPVPALSRERCPEAHELVRRSVAGRGSRAPPTTSGGPGGPCLLCRTFQLVGRL